MRSVSDYMHSSQESSASNRGRGPSSEMDGPDCNLNSSRE